MTIPPNHPIHHASKFVPNRLVESSDPIRQPKPSPDVVAAPQPEAIIINQLKPTDMAHLLAERKLAAKERQLLGLLVKVVVGMCLVVPVAVMVTVSKPVVAYVPKFVPSAPIVISKPVPVPVLSSVLQVVKVKAKPVIRWKVKTKVVTRWRHKKEKRVAAIAAPSFRPPIYSSCPAGFELRKKGICYNIKTKHIIFL